MTRPRTEVDDPEKDADGGWRPATVTLPGTAVAEWVRSDLHLVRDLLRRHGAVRLRGATVDAESFGVAVAVVAGAPLGDYLQRSTPRTRVEGNVFTSTQYRHDQVIPMHSEQSYATTWPRIVGFWCAQPADRGGETPLAPTADILDRLPDDLVERFDAHGVRYERWYQPFLDLPWQEVFQTHDPVAVDRFCSEAGIETMWCDDSVLRTRQAAQAVIRHQGQGRRVWFNQANLFHPAALPPAIEAALRARTGERLPRNVMLGDGSPIPARDIATIVASIEDVTWRAPWYADDVVIVDNEAVAHGRAAYGGRRRVLVAMAGAGGGADAERGNG